MGIKSICRAVKNRAGQFDKNVGPLDAKFRITIGVVLILLAPLQALGYAPIPLLSSIGFAIAGLIITIEGLLNRCLLFKLLGINRYPVDPDKNENQ